jgi:uncharacterized protein YndB with AHSA1/START domain
MYTFEKRVFINRTQQEVFEFVTNPANSPQWEKTILSAEWTSDGLPTVGSTFKIIIKFGILKMKTEFEITEWDPFTMYSYKMADRNLQGRTRIKFESKETGTQVTQNSQIQGKGLMKLLEGLFGRQSEKGDGRAYDALKLLLEAG